MNEQGRLPQNNDLPAVNLSNIDPLTGVFNRYYLTQTLPQNITEAKENNSEVCLFIIDVDDFKHINDAYGHLMGDEILKGIARIIKECVRGDDPVIRYAGDEFMILSRGVGYNLASVIGSRIVEGVNKTIFETKEGGKIHLSISAGVAVYPHDGHHPDELIENADRALYLSKERGKNKFSAAKDVNLGMITKKEILKVFPCRKFIDREIQFERLKGNWQISALGKTKMVFIKGEPGIGKTRILNEFADYLTSAGVFSLKVECDKKYTLQPYYFIAHALGKQLEKKNDLLADSIYFLSAVELEALVYLIPQIRNVLKNDILSFSEVSKEKSKELSVNIFKGLRNLFVGICRQNGFYLYFDNIHWLDKATFELLAYFMGMESGRKILMCGSFCEEQLENLELPCLDFLSGPKNETNFEIIELLPFTLEQAKELIVRIFPGLKAKDEFFESVYGISRGNPFFVEELLKYLIESENIIYKENQWQITNLGKMDIPASLDEVMKRRIRNLDMETKEMLAHAALIGEDFQLEVLRRLVEKNEGYLLELIDRAKQRFLIEEKESNKGFNFLSSSLQNVFYNEISPMQKNSLHNKAGNLISELYANNLNLVSGEAIYHYYRADNKSKLAEYKQGLAKSSLDLFNPQELSEYVEALTKEIAGYERQQKPAESQIEEIGTEIDEETLVSVAALIRSIFVAIRSITLYPPLNRIREEAVKKVYSQLKEMLTHAQSLTFSDVERILLINGNRMPARTEKAIIDSFISLMVERDIKALQFLQSLTEEEINEFLSLLAKEADDLRKEGGICFLLRGKNVENIRINVADYSQQVTQKSARSFSKEKLITMVLMDFLTGKTLHQNVDKNAVLKVLKNAPQELAKNILEAANAVFSSDKQGANVRSKIIAENIRTLGIHILPGGWQENKQDLAKLLANLNTQLRNEVLSTAQNSTTEGMNIIREVITKFSDDEIIEMITSGYTRDKDVLFNMRELLNRLAVDKERRKNILPRLEEELKKKGLEESEISYVTQKEYKNQPLDDRLDALFKLPAHLYPSIGMDDIKSLIEDLTMLSKKDNLHKLIIHFLSQLEETSEGGKLILLELLIFTITLFSCETDEFDVTMAAINEAFARRLEKEESRERVIILLKGVQLCIDWVVSSSKSPLTEKRWILRSRFSALTNLVNSLYNITEAANAQKLEQIPLLREKKLSVVNFWQGLSRSEFVDILIGELNDPSLEYNKMIENMIVCFGQTALRALIVSSLEEAKIDSSFEGYLYHRKISNVLIRMADVACDELAKFLSMEQEIKKLIILIRFTQGIKNDRVVEILSPFSNSRDPRIKEEVILALSNITTAKSKALLMQMKSDKDRRISRLAAESLKKFK